MDEVAFHCEPPANIPTLVTAFTGWIDAGEAATAAMRFLVRQLAAEPLATIDLEEFVDFTQERPVVRLSAEDERTIRWPRSAFWLWQPPSPTQGCCCFGRIRKIKGLLAIPWPHLSSAPGAGEAVQGCRGGQQVGQVDSPHRRAHAQP
jgi:hypothetical protein